MSYDEGNSNNLRGGDTAVRDPRVYRRGYS